MEKYYFTFKQHVQTFHFPCPFPSRLRPVPNPSVLCLIKKTDETKAGNGKLGCVASQADLSSLAEERGRADNSSRPMRVDREVIGTEPTGSQVRWTELETQWRNAQEIYTVV